MGVKMRAVASLESSIEMRLPRRKVLKKRRRELFPERRAAWTANQSKSPAASASVERLIIPRKKKKVFQSLNKVARATPGLSRPRTRRSPAPVSAMMASLILYGRIIIPSSVRSAISEIRTVLVSAGIWKKRNIDWMPFPIHKLLHILIVTRVIAVFRRQEGEAG